jgi:hypothetical protein
MRCRNCLVALDELLAQVDTQIAKTEAEIESRKINEQ